LCGLRKAGLKAGCGLIATTGEKTVGQIAEPYPVSLAAISKPLKVLDGTHLIHREKKGSFQMVRIKRNADEGSGAADCLLREVLKPAA
jgi:DNA-binding transcriptional ArsR family regulator